MDRRRGGHLPDRRRRRLLEPVTRLCAGRGQGRADPVSARAVTAAGRPAGGVRRLPRPVARLRAGHDAGPRRQAADRHRGGRSALVVLSPVLLASLSIIRSVTARPSCSVRPGSASTGRPFTVYKFRTMVPDAEDAPGRGRSTSKRDPRATPSRRPTIRGSRRSGRFLRRTSLDELPQLWNVLRGRDEPRRAAPAAARRGRPLRRLAPAAADHEARDHRALAGGGAPRAGVRPLGGASTWPTSTGGRSGWTSGSSCGRSRRCWPEGR